MPNLIPNSSTNSPSVAFCIYSTFHNISISLHNLKLMITKLPPIFFHFFFIIGDFNSYRSPLWSCLYTDVKGKIVENILSENIISDYNYLELHTFSTSSNSWSTISLGDKTDVYHNIDSSVETIFLN